MKIAQKLHSILLFTTIALLPINAQAASLVNGGFESGFTGWTRVDQLGSDGGFFVQQGLLSPVNGVDVPAPPEGSQAAMTDAGAGGTHVLYQDFVVPNQVNTASLGFSLFLNNTADKYYIPNTLDWAAANTVGLLNLNQQARVDILLPGVDVFSLNVLLNLFQTATADPLVSGYDSYNRDITALLQSHAGETLRLRFAEVDNVGLFNFGVDNVNISIANRIPEPSVLLLVFGGLSALSAIQKRKKSAG